MSNSKERYVSRVPLNITVSKNTKRILDEHSEKMELPISRVIDSWAREKDSSNNKTIERDTTPQPKTAIHQMMEEQGIEITQPKEQETGLECARRLAKENQESKPQNADLPKPKSFKKSAPYKQESDSEWLSRLNKDNPSYDAQEDTDDEELPASIRLSREMKTQRENEGHTDDDIPDFDDSDLEEIEQTKEKIKSRYKEKSAFEQALEDLGV